MRIRLRKHCRLLLVSAVLTALLRSPEGSRGSEPNRDQALPPGSIVFHGSPKPAAQLSTSPEYLFGLEVQRAMMTNGVSVIVQAFDLDALYHRFVPTLPISDDLKQQLYALARDNDMHRSALQKMIVGDIYTFRLYFLGVRFYGSDMEILFRDFNGAGAPYYEGSPLYIGYVTRRDANGTVRLVDVHRFLSTGELMSQTLRREALQSFVRKGALQLPMNASDTLLLANVKSVSLYETRCGSGRYDLIKAAYDQLPPGLQDDPHILFQYATCGDHSIGDILLPVERWHKLDPDEPCPYLLLVDYYWRLYNRPRTVSDGPYKGTHLKQYWTPEEEEGVTAAIQKANVWFADPAMELRLAHYFGTNQPAKARALLLQAIQRTPVLPQAFSELLKLDLSQRDFGGVADTLHRGEIAFETNFTAMVTTSTNMSAFRQSPEFKKWQHDYHAATSTAAK